MVKVGDKVTRFPVTFNVREETNGKTMTGPIVRGPMRGTVAYVHPEGRYHMVEFETAGGTVRECFKGVEA